jgi:hypothetical protein
MREGAVTKYRGFEIHEEGGMYRIVHNLSGLGVATSFEPLCDTIGCAQQIIDWKLERADPASALNHFQANENTPAR